jgi:hypothetical protein
LASETTSISIGPDDVKPEAAKPEALRPAGNSEIQSIEMSADTPSVAVTTESAQIAPDANKDQAHVPEVAMPAAPKSGLATAPKRGAQIALFISRKDSKLYVRQNFAPLFETPVTIAASDRPLGTHVFTAQVDSNDANLLHWSVVSLPARSPHPASRDKSEFAPHWHKLASAVAGAKSLPTSDGPTEALDRIVIPADAMARIAETLSTGASIIVSDQGVGDGETGDGTDFIVSLR